MEAKGKCQTCGGSKIKTSICTPHDEYPRTTRRSEPCPDCPEPEDAGEFVEEKRRLQMLYDKHRWFGINPLQVIKYLDRLSQQARQIAELQTKLKEAEDA